MKVVLSIAGSDSGGGAGIQADLKTFAAHGVHGATAVTAITAQNSVRVAEVFALDPRLVVAQIEAVTSDMEVAAAKTGMLANRGIVEAVAGAVARLRIPHLVVDPVMVAKGGDSLLDKGAVRAYLDALFPLAAVLTPNLPETRNWTWWTGQDGVPMTGPMCVVHRQPGSSTPCPIVFVPIRIRLPTPWS